MPNQKWYAELGRRFVAARGALGMTQRDLALALGVQASRLSRIERGLEKPTLNNFMSIREATGIDIKLPPAPPL